MKRWATAMATLILTIIVLADLGVLHIARRAQEIPFGDKIGHFVLFGVLNLLVILSVRESRPGWTRLRVAALCSVLLLLAAALEEYTQLYIHARTFSLWDLGADFAGIGVFAIIAALIQRRRDGAERRTPTDRLV